jgi:tRNA-splicing endonuclease subunit Sen2
MSSLVNFFCSALSSAPTQPRSKSSKSLKKAAQQQRYANPLPVSPPPSTISFLSHLFSVTNTKSRRYRGVWSPSTRSVIIHNDAEAAELWRQGMWGKASLSRSEPTWRTRKTKEMQGNTVVGLETVTSLRRKERAEFKEERVKNERLERERQLRVEASETLSSLQDQETLEQSKEAQDIPEEPKRKRRKVHVDLPKDELPVYSESYLDKESLHLSPEEALFLFLLDFLEILPENNPENSTPLTLSQFLHLVGSTARPDDPFLVKYLAYHFYRRQRLVVKTGLKFGVDYLLYDKPVPLTHARRCVNVLGSYHLWPDAEDEGQRVERLVKSELSWQEIMLWQRLMGTVRKKLVLCYVEIPRLSDNLTDDEGGRRGWRDVKTKEEFEKVLQSYKIREMGISRVVMSRERDEKPVKK